MSFLINILIILAIVIIGTLLFYRYFKKLDFVDDEALDINLEETDMDIKFLVRDIKNVFDQRLKRQVIDENISSQEAERRKKRRDTLKKAIRYAQNGDSRSKKVLKSDIKAQLFDEKYGLNENTINNIIPFNRPDRLSGNDLFEILVYIYNREHGIYGFAQMMKDYRSEWENHYDSAVGEKRHHLSLESLRIIYEDVMEGTAESIRHPELTFDDKVEILAQRVFEMAFGFGVIDLLYESTIDEIDCGVSGVAADGASAKYSDKRIAYSYESIWIVFSGTNVQLECLSFGSQRELVRVTSNIYRYDAPYVLSRLKAAVVSTMIDGSRIVAVRPPFADSWGFFLRKFDSAPSVRLITDDDSFALLREENSYLAVALLRLLIRGQRNIAFTGSQGTGKTTFLKAAIRYIDPALNLRIQELQFELNLRFAYPKRNVVTFQETAELDAQFGLNLQKKTNGSVNIIGEVANAVQAGFIIQTARVASLMALFTHHAKTPTDLVEAISDNLLQLRLYADKKDAVAACAGILNIDWHLTNADGNRHTERVSEIIPLTDMKYPSEYVIDEKMKDYVEKYKESHGGLDPKAQLIQDKFNGISLQDRMYMDAPEYFKRSTDPELFEVRQLMHWEPVSSDPKAPGKFVLDNLPSEETLKDMKEKIVDEAERANFEEDIAILRQFVEGKTEDDIEGFDTWKEKIISY